MDPKPWKVVGRVFTAGKVMGREGRVFTTGKVMGREGIVGDP